MDQQVMAVQEFLEKKSDQTFPYDELAGRFGMSRRTFEPRFTTAAGDTPLIYLQRVRWPPLP
jgi:transcriptional regulator GlxA family with amidase domain